MDAKQVGLESFKDFEQSLSPEDESAAYDEHGPVAMPEDSASPSGAKHQYDDDEPIPIPDDDAPRPAGPAGTTSLDVHQRWVGRTFSHFRLMRVMGSGAMGVVFQAEDTNLKRITALKVLRRQVRGSQSQKQVDRFLLEARAAAAIDHPSIAQVYEINEHDGWWFIAMEFLEGGSLLDLVAASGPMAPGQAAVMVTDAARGLAAAHEAGVIHRDIKPANLMLSRRGRCKLVDFGLVKLDSADNPFQDDDAKVIGTPHYVAPEVVQRKGAGPPADVYSLGATLYAILTGEPPFPADELSEIFQRTVKEAPPDVRKLAPYCPPEMASLIKRSMAKDPDARPSASEFAATIQRQVSMALASESQEGSGISSYGTSSVAGYARRRRRQRWALAAAGVVLALIATTAATRFLVSGGGAAPPNIATPSEDAAPGAQLEPGWAITNDIGMKLVHIPPGRFTMGSPPGEPGRNGDERPVEVILTKPIFMSATEVTQAQWAQVMGDDYVPPEGVHPNEEDGLRFIGDSLPAYVSWYEAAEFCRRLGQMKGRLYRLPTEAEWEYACRAGTTSAFNVGDSLGPPMANVDEMGSADDIRANRRPMPVASFPANDWGLHDMHGNVAEWCMDWKGDYPLGPLTDPTGPPEGAVRVLRGGHWDGYPRFARSANRWANYPVLRTDYIGFRVLLEPDEPPSDREPYLVERRPSDEGQTPVSASAASESVTRDSIPVDPRLPDYQPDTILDMRVRMVGSDTMDRLILLWETEFAKSHTRVEFRHEGRGSGTAVPSLVEGISHFGPMSRPLKPEEIREFQGEYGYEPIQFHVASDAMAVYVHPENPIAERGLSLAELDAIMSTSRKRAHPQDVATWGDLDLEGEWVEIPITVYGRNPASGTYGVFKKDALLGGEFKPTNIELIGSAEVVEAVAADRSGIGYSSIGYDRPDAVALSVRPDHAQAPVAPSPEAVESGAYPLARPLFLTIDHPPQAELTDLHREFLRFVYSRQGQELVVESGFYPLGRDMAATQLERVDLRLPR